MIHADDFSSRTLSTYARMVDVSWIQDEHSRLRSFHGSFQVAQKIRPVRDHHLDDARGRRRTRLHEHVVSRRIRIDGVRLASEGRVVPARKT